MDTNLKKFFVGLDIKRNKPQQIPESIPISEPSSRTKNKKEFSEEKKAQIHKEEIAHLRRKNQIHITGDGIPDVAATFQDLTTIYNLNSTLRNNIPYQKPTPIQMQAIPLMLKKREILGFAPTGSGKTAAFLIPMLNTVLKISGKPGIKAVIVAPTRELATQITQECHIFAKELELKITLLIAKSDGSLDDCDILITTPNKLVYMINSDPPTVNLATVRWLVVDESDKLFEQGETGFRSQLATIFRACSHKRVVRAMFSATYLHDVHMWAQDQLKDLAVVSVGQRNTSVSSVKQELRFVGDDRQKKETLKQIIQKGYKPPMLVFVNKKETVKYVTKFLVENKIPCASITSEMKEARRDYMIRNFNKGNIPILICTDLVGRGLDFNEVNIVVNFDLPRNTISYIHRVGRTGRAGKEGRAITFFTHFDFDSIQGIAKAVKQAGGEVAEYLLRKPKRKRPLKKGGSNNKPNKRAKKSKTDDDDIIDSDEFVDSDDEED